MYKTSPINKNKVLSGLQIFTFDEIENYRTHVFEKHSVMDDTKNLDLVLRGKKQAQSCFIADINNPGDTNANVKYAKEIINNAIMDNSSKVVNWLDGSDNGDTFELSYDACQIVGVGFFNNNKNLIKEYSSNNVMVILERNDAMKYGFNVLTAYPVTNKGERERTEKRLDEIAAETNAYKCSDNVEKAYLIYRTDPASKFEINCKEDRTTGNSTISVTLKSKNPNIISKIRISDNQYSLTTYRKEYNGISSNPSLRPIETKYTRLSSENGYISLVANLHKEKVFKQLKESLPIVARDVQYIYDLIKTNGEARRNVLEAELKNDMEK